MDAALCVDLFVVGEPEDLGEELGQAQAGAKLGYEARRLVGFDVRIGMTDDRTYASPNAFRQALTARLRTVERESRWSETAEEPVQQTHQQDAPV